MEKLQQFKPRMKSPSKVSVPIPRQVKRALPIYGIIILIYLFLSWGPSLGSGSGSGAARKDKRGLTGPKRSSPPPTKGSKFPKKIWQSWKVDPLGFEERDSTCARTWTSKNPGHRYEVLTDNNDVYYVESHFGPDGLNRPDIVEVYSALTAKIIKADLLRYLVMYVEGGLYADIDVENLKPINRFIPERYNEGDIEMVIGVEIDQPEFASHAILGPKSQSFCQWTFMCKPGLPVMMRLVENILLWLNELSKKQGVPISQLVLDFDEVISGTGPSAFTGAVLAEMSLREGRKVTWDAFHALGESKVVGGVLILTVEAFAAGQGHSDSGNHNARTALVKHRYHASKWPTAHPRYKHPVYGEVEKCNWVIECVKMWDYNTALFKGLSHPEQQKLIFEKQQADFLQALEDDKFEKQLALFVAAEEANKKHQEAAAAAGQPFVAPPQQAGPVVANPPSAGGAIPGFQPGSPAAQAPAQIPLQQLPPAQAIPPAAEQLLVQVNPLAQAFPPTEAQPPAQAIPPAAEQLPVQVNPLAQAFPPTEAQPPAQPFPPAQAFPPAEAQAPPQANPPMQAFPPTEAQPLAQPLAPAQAFPPTGAQPPAQLLPPAQADPLAQPIFPADGTPPLEAQPAAQIIPPQLR